MEASDLLKQARFSLRTFVKAPVFTLVAVASLAIGIGANTAIFSLVDQLLLRLLPVKDPRQLVQLTGAGRHYGGNNGPNRLSYPMYADIRDRNTVFSGMFCSAPMGMSVNFGGGAEHVAGEFVSGNYFRVLGVQAAAGRLITSNDDLRQGEHPVAVLSFDYWQSRFGMRPDVIGQKAWVNGYPVTIIGVSQAGFDGTEVGRAPQIRIPMMLRPKLTTGDFATLNNRRARWVIATGRLKPGTTLENAQAGLQPLFHQIINMEVLQPPFGKASEHAKQGFLRMYMKLLPASKGQSYFRRRFSKPLIVLMSLVGLVLLIACANVANLLLARAAARQKEMAIRLAMGASRRQIVAQLLGESLLLSLISGVIGIVLAVSLDKLLLSFLPHDETPISLAGTLDWPMLAFALAVSLLTGLLFGLVPALQSTRPNLAPTLKDQATAVAGGSSMTFRKMLVAVQVALSLLLLVGAGLFIRSLSNLRDLDPGFRTRNLLSFGIDPTLNGYPPARTRAVYRNLLDRLRVTPGVKLAALAIMPVLQDSEWDMWVTVEGYTPKPGDIPDPHFNFVSPGYFKALDIRLLTGRDFDDRDDKTSPKVCIVNEKFARHYFHRTNVLGRHIGVGGDPGTKTDITIVGVSRNTKYEGMRDDIPEEVFEPYRQLDFESEMFVYAETASKPETMFQTMRDLVRSIDPNLPITRLRSLEEQKDLSLMTERLVANLSAAFAFVASLLAGIGLYGVMTYTVAWRTREIGVRMALGASIQNVLWLVVREILVLVGFGIGISLPVTWILSTLLRSQLYGLTPNDPASIVAAALGLALVATIAGYVPSRRAARIDPMRALRWE